MKSHEVVVESLKTNPEDWRANEFMLENRTLNLKIWIANGALFCREERGKLSWGLIAGFIIWAAYKKWCVSVMQERMYKQAIDSLEG